MRLAVSLLIRWASPSNVRLSGYFFRAAHRRPSISRAKMRRRAPPSIKRLQKVAVALAEPVAPGEAKFDRVLPVDFVEVEIRRGP